MMSDAMHIRRQTEENGSKISFVIIIIIIIYVPHMFVINKHLA